MEQTADPVLLQQLHSEDSEARAMAALELSRLEDFGALQTIARQLLEEENVHAAEAMLVALKRLSVSFLKPLTPLFYSDSPMIRNGAVEIFHDASEGNLLLISELARSQDKDVRKFAIDSLRGNYSKTAIVTMRDKLFDPEVNIQLTAVEYLAELGDQESAGQILELYRTTTVSMLRFTCLRALADINCDPIRDEVLEAVPPDLSVLNALEIPLFLRLLGRLGQRVDVERIGALLQQDSNFVSEATEALEMLQRRLEIEAFPESLCQVLREKLPEALPPERTRLLRLLGEKENQDVIRQARAQLASPNEMDILSALSTFRDFGSEEDLALLEDRAGELEDEVLLEEIADTMFVITGRLSGGAL